MSKKFTYAKAGVDRELRAKSKETLKQLSATYKYSRYGTIIRLPYGNIFPFGDRCLDFVIEGVGSKVLLAQLADKYDTIGIDAVALAVNDVIRSGAKPLTIVDNIHAQVSNPGLVDEWIKGIAQGAIEAECFVPAGEIGDVPEVIKGLMEGKGFDMVVASIGEVAERDIVYGNKIEPGDVVIGLRSSGIHSNGITLARKILFREWGGKYKTYDVPDRLNREIVFEVLEPMKIYVKPIMNVLKEFDVKGLVHITGDAYLKFNRLMEFSKGIGFEFDNFKPQPIFQLIQETTKELKKPITDEEMLKTFNMGWGFAVVCKKEDEYDIIDSFRKSKTEAELIGKVNASEKIVATWRKKALIQ
jgi:phosphoribosylformylglycinamidine cyclo-ligase